MPVGFINSYWKDEVTMDTYTGANEAASWGSSVANKSIKIILETKESYFNDIDLR